MKNKVFIINWNVLSNFGGIEKIVAYLIKFLSEQGNRVIWLKNKDSVVNTGFQSFLENKNIEVVNVYNNHLFWFKHDRINIIKDDEVTIISYTVFDMLKALSLKNNLNCKRKTSLYFIPDTTGRYFFIEEYFKGWLKNVVYKRIKATLRDWENSNLIRFCAPDQITSFERHYGISVTNKEAKLNKGLFAPPALDMKELENRSERNGCFNIITVGRFDFPHKGYMLGLVRAFGRLKPKYPQLTLSIIGLGQHEQMLKNEIANLPQGVQADVNLLGAVPHTELPHYFRDKHLSIAVAGAASDAARNGVLSIAARNFCDNECEVYGFYPESFVKNSSKEPGELVDKYIEDAINMTKEEYTKRCKDSYMVFTDPARYNPTFLYTTTEMCKDYYIGTMDLYFYKVINYLRKLLMLLGKK